MKRIIVTFFLLLFIFAASAQTTSYGNFKVNDQEIIYQKVFNQDSITSRKLADYYKDLPYVKNINPTSEGISFEVEDITVDFKKFQFKPTDTPPIIQTGKYSGKVSIAVRDGRYKIVLNAIQVTGDMGYKKIAKKENLTNYACKNNGTILSQDWCRPNMLGLLDKAFTDKLQFAGKDKEEW